jgi:hypothetical protein
MIAGLATLGGTYLGSAFIGSILQDSTDCANCQPAGDRLLIPIAGPWLALPYSDNAAHPFLVLLGLGQAAGLLMAIIGISQYSADAEPPADDVRRPQARAGGPFTVGLVPVGDGALGFVGGRF